MRKRSGIIATTIFTLGMMFSTWSVSASPTITTSYDATKKGSITIYKLESKDGANHSGTGLTESSITETGIAGDTFAYWKVGDLIQTASQQYYTLDRAFVTGVKSVGGSLTAVSVNGKDCYRIEEINKVMNDVSATFGSGVPDGSQSGNEVLRSLIQENGTAMSATDSSGKTSVTNLELGLYAISEGELPTGVVRPGNPFLVALPMTNVAPIEDHSAGSVWQYDVVVYPKSEVIHLQQDLVAEGNDVNDGSSSNSLVRHTDKNVGDSIRFVVQSEVPKLQPLSGGTANQNRTYILHIVPGVGLTKNCASVKVSLGTNAWNGTNTVLSSETYQVEADSEGNGFTVTLNSKGLKLLDAISTDSVLYVEYPTILNEQTVQTKTGAVKNETSQVSLTYGTKDSKDVVRNGNTDLSVHTYEVSLTQSFSSDIEDMSAVCFEVAQEDANLTFVKESEGVYHKSSSSDRDSTPVSKVSVSKTGKLVLKGLDSGTYSMEAVGTVSGFNLMKDPMMLEFEKGYPQDGTLQSATLTTGSNTPLNLSDGLSNGCVNFTVESNESVSVLRTGGTGFHTIRYGIAATVFAIGCAILITRRKKV